MKLNLVALFGILAMMTLVSCTQKAKDSNIKIIFLHQSTGGIIWQGTNISFIQKVAGKISIDLKYRLARKPRIPSLMKEYNEEHSTNYNISEKHFPSQGGNNPINYYNVWVGNTGDESSSKGQTLKTLTKDYQVIIFKHCYTASHIKPDMDSVDAHSSRSTLNKYKVHYNALGDKLREFPNTKFILFTVAVEVESEIEEDEALRTKEFVNWVIEEWDQPDDNIFLWDLYSLQTDGGLYFQDKYAIAPNDSHPNAKFAAESSLLLFKRIIDVIENQGNSTSLTGEEKILPFY